MKSINWLQLIRVLIAAAIGYGIFWIYGAAGSWLITEGWSIAGYISIGVGVIAGFAILRMGWAD